jgi:hypothetical protein
VGLTAAGLQNAGSVSKRVTEAYSFKRISQVKRNMQSAHFKRRKIREKRGVAVALTRTGSIGGRAGSRGRGGSNTNSAEQKEQKEKEK